MKYLNGIPYMEHEPRAHCRVGGQGISIVLDTAPLQFPTPSNWQHSRSFFDVHIKHTLAVLLNRDGKRSVITCWFVGKYKVFYPQLTT